MKNKIIPFLVQNNFLKCEVCENISNEYGNTFHIGLRKICANCFEKHIKPFRQVEIRYLEEVISKFVHKNIDFVV